MTPSSSSYTTTAGELHHYVTYVCPGYLDGNCKNKKRIQEPWLREQVVGSLCNRLFPAAVPGGLDAHDPTAEDWFQALTADVRQEFERMDAARLDQRPNQEAELEELQSKINGWMQTLGKPDLAMPIRTALEGQWALAAARQQEIHASLHESGARKNYLDQLLDPQQVVDRLTRLDELLALGNPTLGNLELSLHIDRIECYLDGQVRARICKLGVLAEDGLALLITDDEPQPSPEPADSGRITPRRRAVLRVHGAEGDEEQLEAAAHFAADPSRFEGLPDKWFWVDSFQAPDGSPSWKSDYAEAVFMRRQQARLSYSKLAEEFGVTAPTIGAAIRHYEETHPGTKDQVSLKAGGKRRPKFDLATFGDEARTLWLRGWPKEKLADKFECSPPTVTKALQYVYERDGIAMPTSQQIRQGLLARARSLLAADHSLDEIAAIMEVSDVTARQYLRESYAAEGKPMPDLRRRKSA